MYLANGSAGSTNLPPTSSQHLVRPRQLSLTAEQEGSAGMSQGERGSRRERGGSPRLLGTIRSCGNSLPQQGHQATPEGDLPPGPKHLPLGPISNIRGHISIWDLGKTNIQTILRSTEKKLNRLFENTRKTMKKSHVAWVEI